MLGASPADSQALKGHADGLAGQEPGRPAFAVANPGEPVQRPHTGRLTEETRAVVQQVLQGFGEALVQVRAGRTRPAGFRLQASEPLASEGVQGMVDGAYGTSQVAGDRGRAQAVGA